MSTLWFELKIRIFEKYNFYFLKTAHIPVYGSIAVNIKHCAVCLKLDYTLRCLENICSVSSSCFRKYVVCHVFKWCITAINCILLSMHLFQTMLKQNQRYCCTNIGCTSCVNLSYVSRKYHKRSIGGIFIALRIMYICK